MNADKSWAQWTQFGITTFAVIVGAFITGSYQWVQERVRRPKLELDYAGAEGKNRVEIKHMTGGKEFAGIYIRVRLRNLGRSTAKNCLVFVTGVEEVQKSGVTEAPFHDSAPITWAGWGFDPRDVPPVSTITAMSLEFRRPNRDGCSLQSKFFLVRPD